MGNLMLCSIAVATAMCWISPQEGCNGHFLVDMHILFLSQTLLLPTVL